MFHKNRRPYTNYKQNEHQPFEHFLNISLISRVFIPTLLSLARPIDCCFRGGIAIVSSRVEEYFNCTCQVMIEQTRQS